MTIIWFHLQLSLEIKTRFPASQPLKEVFIASAVAEKLGRSDRFEGQWRLLSLPHSFTQPEFLVHFCSKNLTLMAHLEVMLRIPASGEIAKKYEDVRVKIVRAINTAIPV